MHSLLNWPRNGKHLCSPSFQGFSNDAWKPSTSWCGFSPRNYVSVPWPCFTVTQWALAEGASGTHCLQSTTRRTLNRVSQLSLRYVSDPPEGTAFSQAVLISAQKPSYIPVFLYHLFPVPGIIYYYYIPGSACLILAKINRIAWVWNWQHNTTDSNR